MIPYLGEERLETRIAPPSAGSTMVGDNAWAGGGGGAETAKQRGGAEAPRQRGRETQRDAERRRETQRDAERCRETDGRGGGEIKEGERQRETERHRERERARAQRRSEGRTARGREGERRCEGGTQTDRQTEGDRVHESGCAGQGGRPAVVHHIPIISIYKYVYKYPSEHAWAVTGGHGMQVELDSIFRALFLQKQKKSRKR